ncbi:outer membrane lipoprotein-sorting protein [Kangiella profundi]|uniref:Outer membrane lipoprotein-sorting protein n=1 Tax=Kangiella profundi TaxID=1561924 RepID=A0A2K9ALX5_9GAMM|nr:outer membrane lipoprotein-sorting protein [Kangiella profundi]AUD79934.1 outer membrane lipoprotein-sorting protein [Kangiella profundi]GGE94089.1 membrane protein [Kangiella profundi]
MKRILSSLLLVAAAVSMTTTAVAETPEEKGLAIAKEAKARNTGWGDSQADMTMILRDKGGNEAERIVKVKSLEVKGDGDKGLSVFEQPRDVEGTAFLNYSHIEGNDDQWLFLPALKRVKRISSSNKSGPWMGSEFAYEDLSSFEVEKYDYKFLRDDELNGEKMFVVEMVPTYNNSGYSKTIAWIDQEHYRVHRIEFFDQKNDKLKELNMSEFKQYLDKYWRAHRQEMENVQTGKSTTIIWKDYEFNVGLSEDDFNKSSLKRAR